MYIPRPRSAQAINHFIPPAAAVAACPSVRESTLNIIPAHDGRCRFAPPDKPFIGRARLPIFQTTFPRDWCTSRSLKRSEFSLFMSPTSYLPVGGNRQRDNEKETSEICLRPVQVGEASMCVYIYRFLFAERRGSCRWYFPAFVRVLPLFGRSRAVSRLAIKFVGTWLTYIFGARSLVCVSCRSVETILSIRVKNLDKRYHANDGVYRKKETIKCIIIYVYTYRDAR